MPELPEVETIKRVIDPQIQGLTIENVTVKRPEVIDYPTADEFCRRLTGQTISHMTRRGKFLVIHLNSNDRFILHLRMTGCLLLTPTDYLEEKHTHVIFRFFTWQICGKQKGQSIFLNIAKSALYTFYPKYHKMKKSFLPLFLPLLSYLFLF